ncbi:MAG TPA: nucleoside phosphorylase [Candidatus Binatia bacterium]|nr:nucleoside phosphorylase [Candidatus Binatia bacterium]
MAQAGDRQYHLQAEPGDVGAYVLLPGDPARCRRIAERLEGPRQVAANREFTTFSGSLDGVPVSVTSTGIGGPSTAIAVEELVKLGASTLVRVGTCGSLGARLEAGDVVIVQAAARGEGTTSHYAPTGFPAVADLDVTLALREAARAAGFRHRVGVVLTNDAFYAEMEPESFPMEAEIRERWRAWARAGCLAAEMESATLLTVAAVRGVRAGAVLAVIDEASAGLLGLPDAGGLPIDPAIDTAVAGLRRLIAADRDRGGGAAVTRA